jgi:hypothetical protein
MLALPETAPHWNLPLTTCLTDGMNMLVIGPTAPPRNDIQGKPGSNVSVALAKLKGYSTIKLFGLIRFSISYAGTLSVVRRLVCRVDSICQRVAVGQASVLLHNQKKATFCPSIERFT